MAVRLSALRAGRPLPPGRFLVPIYVRGWVDPRVTVQLEGLGKLKKSTSSGLDPATFRHERNNYTATEEWCFLCGPYREVISRTVSRVEWSEESASQSRDAVAEARGQFGSTEEGERPPLKAVARRLVKTQQAEKTEVCALVNCKVRELVKRL
jgi:hypothetical protein